MYFIFQTKSYNITNHLYNIYYILQSIYTIKHIQPKQHIYNKNQASQKIINHKYFTIQNIYTKILYTTNTINYNYSLTILYIIIHTILQIHIININKYHNRTTPKNAPYKALQHQQYNYIPFTPSGCPGALLLAYMCILLSIFNTIFYTIFKLL